MLGPNQQVETVRVFMEGYGLEAIPTLAGAASALAALRRKGKAMESDGLWTATK